MRVKGSIAVTGSTTAGSTAGGDLIRQVADPASRHDPYPLYARLRENRVNLLPDRGYALGRYADVVAMRHDPRISSDPHNASAPGSALLEEPASFIQRDPPDHDRLRAIATRYFGPPVSPQVVSGREPAIRSLVNGLVDSLPSSGDADLVDQPAHPLPVSVFSELLGVPTQNHRHS